MSNEPTPAMNAELEKSIKDIKINIETVKNVYKKGFISPANYFEYEFHAEEIISNTENIMEINMKLVGLVKIIDKEILTKISESNG